MNGRERSFSLIITALAGWIIVLSPAMQHFFLMQQRKLLGRLKDFCLCAYAISVQAEGYTRL